jgi:hypothetical protein
MAEAKLKILPFIGMWLFPGAFLFITLWHSIFRGGWSFVLSVLLLLGFIVYVAASLLIALFYRSTSSWIRVGISLVAMGAFMPTAWLGNELRDQIFLANLSTYQAMTDVLISQNQSLDSHRLVRFPPGYWSMLVADRARIERDDQSVTVFYQSGDSFALGHDGYLYRSDDNMQALKSGHPDIGLFRLAPKWYVWGT